MEKKVKTKLSLTEKYEDIISDVQKDILQEEISDLSSMKENDINISTIYVFDDGEDLEAKVYFRNATSNKINFEYVPLILVNSDEQVISRKIFDLRELGDIPSGGARPWKLHFDKQSSDMELFKNKQCRVIFNMNLKAVNYANIEYEQLSQDYMNIKPVFDRFLEQLPKIEKGQLSFSVFDISIGVNGNIVVTLVIRNSSNEIAEIKEIPVTIKDKNDNLVVSGRFTLNDFKVSSMKAQVCNLAFEANIQTEVAKSVKDQWHICFE